MTGNETFTNETGGVRLDAALLSRFPSSTKAFVREAIARGAVLVNGRPAPKGLKLSGGETIKVLDLKEADDNRVRPDPEIPVAVVYEDQDLVAFDKPAGMPVQPLDCEETGTLMNGVAARFPECTAIGDSPLMAGALHRIDADTSGLVLVARTQAAFAAVRGQFAAQTVVKKYLALVEGKVESEGRLENDLAHEPGIPFCRMIDARKNRLCESERRRLKPLHAITEFRPCGSVKVECETRTLLDVTIMTGVTHQIRAQLAMAGMHIVNDRTYGAFAVEGMTGHCLHSLSAAFVHPSTGKTVSIATPPPAWASL